MSNSDSSSPKAKPMDSAKLEAKFKRAVEYIQSNPAESKVTPTMQLLFYGLFRQATTGPNTTPPPSRTSVVDRMKWQAWKDNRKLTKEAAMKKYLMSLKAEDPDWKVKHKERQAKSGSVVPKLMSKL